ncbi:hypothetical protein BJV78DRAFT_877074 [Lactifluus subvellereus]|nr:hypothetical protein BJV78DRAFT_877074 [Lactifluus subvellereus]
MMKNEMASLVNGNKVRRHSKARIALFSILGLYVIILTVLFTTTLVLLDERREWERERETNEPKRRGHVPFWGTARLLTAECPEDRIRQYDASMHNLLVEDDWYAACMNTAIDIAGRRLASPRTCMNYGLDGGVRGYWSIEVNSSECKRTIWDNVSQTASLCSTALSLSFRRIAEKHVQ